MTNVKRHVRAGRTVRRHHREKTFYVLVAPDGRMILKPFRYDAEIFSAFMCGSAAVLALPAHAGSIDLTEMEDGTRVYVGNRHPNDAFTCQEELAELLFGLTEAQAKLLAKTKLG